MFICDLIGKPWALPCDPPRTYDCWALAVEVRERMGLKTPVYDVPPESRRAAHRAALAKPDPSVWQRLDTPRDGCLVGFGQRYVVHCGVYIQGRVIQAACPSATQNGSVFMHTLAVTQNFFGSASYWELKDA